MNRTLMLGLMAFVIGCSLKQPAIPLIPTHQLSATPVVSTVPVEFLDERPDWQRKFYAGSDIPRKYRDAISFIPLESLEPGVEDHLREELELMWKRTNQQPTAMTIRLTSFQLVFNDIERMRCEYQEDRQEKREAEREAEEQRQRYATLTGENDCEDQSVGDSLMGAILGAILKEGFILTFEAIAERDQRMLPLRYRNEEELPGLSCKIEAEVVCFFPAGVIREFQVSGSGYQYDGGLGFSPDAIPDTVRTAVVSFVDDLERKLK